MPFKALHVTDALSNKKQQITTSETVPTSPVQGSKIQQLGETAEEDGFDVLRIKLMRPSILRGESSQKRTRASDHSRK